VGPWVVQARVAGQVNRIWTKQLSDAQPIAKNPESQHACTLVSVGLRCPQEFGLPRGWIPGAIRAVLAMVISTIRAQVPGWILRIDSRCVDTGGITRGRAPLRNLAKSLLVGCAVRVAAPERDALARCARCAHDLIALL